MKHVVFVPEPISASGMNLLRSQCDCIAPWGDGSAPGEAELRGMLGHADGVIVRLFAIRAGDLESAPRLKAIAKHGVGVDNIDVSAATALKIPVLFTPTANANAVAEHAMTLMLALARLVVPGSEAMRAGRFHERSTLEGVELAGKTLGVVGFGRIGRRVAVMASRGFAMDVRAYDPVVQQFDGLEGVTLERSLEAVLKRADFLTLHLPLTVETRQLINGARLQLLKPNCRIINTSRGAVIDEAALAAALNDRRIAGAALDVFEHEPLPDDHVLLLTPNTLLTPHVASSTRESLDRMALDAAQGVLDVLNGVRPAYQVNATA
jgi:D-3-phosphoglycerate dehydrogenase